MICACGSGNLLEPVDPSLTLLEFETRMLQVRYTDDSGLPIQAATCTFEIVGTANGAKLAANAAVTDAQGYCWVNLQAQHAAAFKVVVDSDGAGEAKSMTVSVSDDGGGVVEALVADNASATVLTAEVRLVEDFDCADFDPLRPPAPTTFAANPSQLVGLQPGIATKLKIFGLEPGRRYAVLTIGYADGQTRSTDCQQDIVLSEDQVHRREAFALTLNLEDLPVYVGNSLRVTSQFGGELGLEGVAALMRRISDSPDAPLDYVLSQMSLGNDEFVTALISAYRPQLVEAMSDDSSTISARESLARVAATLASVNNIELHSLIDIADVDADEVDPVGVAPSALTVTHRISHFTAEIAGHSERLTVHPNHVLFDSTLAPQLEDHAELTVEDAEDVSISEHHLTVPIADAIVGKVLMDEFGDYRIDRIIAGMVDCSRAGELVAETLPGSSGLAGMFVDPTKRMVVDDMCQNVVSELIKDVYDQIKADLEDYRWDQQVTFAGRASLKLRPDGMKINRLVNGEWTDLGTFSARRW